MTIKRSPCSMCTRFHRPEVVPPMAGKHVLTCDSFPDGIPAEITNGENLHNRTINGEPVFNPVSPDAARRYMRWVVGRQQARTGK